MEKLLGKKEINYGKEYITNYQKKKLCNFTLFTKKLFLQKIISTEKNFHINWNISTKNYFY
jgi:hypothetical protein